MKNKCFRGIHRHRISCNGLQRHKEHGAPPCTGVHRDFATKTLTVHDPNRIDQNQPARTPSNHSLGAGNASGLESERYKKSGFTAAAAGGRPSDLSHTCTCIQKLEFVHRTRSLTAAPAGRSRTQRARSLPRGARGSRSHAESSLASSEAR